MTTQTLDNPMDAAMQATEAPITRTYFGQIITVDAWHCALVRGVGKAPYDPGQHSPDQRRTAITIEIAPLRGEFSVKQDTLDTGKDWLKFTLPSLKELNADLRTLKGRWCRVERVPTGVEYTSKQGDKKPRTAIAFIAFYPNREACQDASDKFWGARQSSPGTFKDDGKNTPQPLPTAPDPAATLSATNDAERQFAAQSLPLLWQAARQDVKAFEGMLNSNPLIGKYFDLESPEVQTLIDPLPF